MRSLLLNSMVCPAKVIFWGTFGGIGFSVTFSSNRFCPNAAMERSNIGIRNNIFFMVVQIY